MTKIFSSPVDLNRAKSRELENDYSRYSDAISSNGLNGRYSDLKGSAITYIENERGILQADRQLADNQTPLAIHKEVAQGVIGAQEINNRLISLLINTRTDRPVSDSSFKTQVKSMLSDLTTLLNGTSKNGEALFAGKYIESKAVTDLTTLPILAAGAPADTSYYIGGTGTVSLTIDSDHTIEKFAVTAAHPAFEKTIRACRICLSGNEVNSNDPAFGSALDLCNEALNDYNTAAAVANLPIDVITRTNQEIEQKKISLSENLKETEAVDKAESLQKLEEARLDLILSRHIAMQNLMDLRDDIKRM